MAGRAWRMPLEAAAAAAFSLAAAAAERESAQCAHARISLSLSLSCRRKEMCSVSAARCRPRGSAVRSLPNLCPVFICFNVNGGIKSSLEISCLHARALIAGSDGSLHCEPRKIQTTSTTT